MLTFRCTIADRQTGKLSEVTISAESETELVKQFFNAETILVKIKEVKDKTYSLSKHKREEVVLEFTRMMEMLTESGLTVKDSLGIISEINGNKKTGYLASYILQEINKGNSFTNIISNMKNIFPPLYRGIIQIGDKIGSVEKIFPKLKEYLEANKKMKEKIQGALIYPCLVLTVAVSGLLALSVFVMPKLTTLFSEFGGEAAEKMQQNINGIQHGCMFFGLLFFLLLITVFICAAASRFNPRIKLFFSRILLKIPVIGKYVKSVNTLHFSFSMETLVSGGITVNDAIEEVIPAISNEAYKKALADVKTEIVRGNSLAQAFKKHKEFPSYINQWLLIGERSGKPEQMFSQIRSYFQNETDRFITRLMVLLEPAMIVFVGIILISLIMTIVVPLFSLYSSIL